MGLNAVSREELLRLWMKIHGKMDRRLHPAFKARAELSELVHYELEVLHLAFKSSPKLVEILRAARRLDPEVRRRLNRLQNAGSLAKPKLRRQQIEPNPPNILPLPGDASSTRRPGKKKEAYRTGEEASLRHLARQYKWWE